MDIAGVTNVWIPILTFVFGTLLMWGVEKRKKVAEAEKQEAEAERAEADNITRYAGEWRELYERRDERANELDKKIDELYKEIGSLREEVRELKEICAALKIENIKLKGLVCYKNGCPNRQDKDAHNNFALGNKIEG